MFAAKLLIFVGITLILGFAVSYLNSF